VVDAQFLHQRYLRDEDQAAMVLATRHSVLNVL
jgi:hypothetical protein